MAFSVEYIYRVLDKMSPTFNKMAAGANKFDKSFTAGMTNVENKLKKTGAKLANLQTGLASLGAGIALKEIINQTDEFNATIGKIGTLIPGQQKRLISLKETITETAIDMGKDLTDISGGAFQVISAFGDMEGETTGRIKGVSKSAVAGGATTVQALNLLSAVTKGYGDTSSIAISKASDLAFMTNKLGQTTFPELAASIGMVVPTAAKLGVSQEQLFASYAALTGVTGNTSMVSTQLSGILAAMLKPTTAMKAAVTKLGFESAATMIKQKGLGESLRLLTEITGGDEEAMAALFGRVEALRGVFALGGSQAGKYSSALEQMQEVSKNIGAVTEEAFLEITEGINKSGFTMKQLGIEMQALKVSFGDELAPILLELKKKYITPLLNKLKEMSPATKKNVMMFLGFITVLGAVLIPLGLMISSIGSLVGLIKGVTIVTKAWGVVTAFMSGMTNANSISLAFNKAQIIAHQIGSLIAAVATGKWALAQGILNAMMSANPIGLVIIGIAALIAIVIIVIKYWDQITAALKKAWNWIIKTWDAVKGLAVAFGGPFIAPLVLVIEYLRSLITHWKEITKAFKEKGILRGILEIGKAILAGLLSPIESFLNMVSKIPGVGNLAKGAAGKIRELRANLLGLESIDVGDQTVQRNPFEVPEVPVPRGNDVNVTTENKLSVYTEKGMNVIPFTKQGKLGYQMVEQTQG